MNPEKMNEDIYKNGELVGVYDMPKEEAEKFCERLTTESKTHNFDWHYFGGRVVVKTLPKKIEESGENGLGEGMWA